MPVRDPGAFELAPAAVPLPAGNLLDDPGAEAGGGWDYAGGFTRERYGTFPFPSAAAGLALGAGSTFFAGGPEASATAQQTVRVVRLAPEIDRGLGTVGLAALLGGYRLDPDRGVVEARFLGPGGRLLDSLALATPTAAERANVTALLPRAQSAPLPRLTRTVEVTLRAERPPGEPRYDDAYFDNVALTLAVPGAPPLAGGRPRHFSGARVLTRRATLGRRGRIPVRIACPDRTAGRCAGTLTLARVPAGRAPRALVATPLAVPAGRARAVSLRAPGGVRREVRERRRLRMRLFLAARDRHGTVRTATIPIVVRAASARGGRRPGSSPGSPGTAAG